MWASHIPNNPLYSEVRNLLQNLPADLKKVLRDKIQPLISGSKSKIAAIKEFRALSGLSLKASKYVVDAICEDGAVLGDIREADPKLLDAIENVEAECRKAIRVCRDDKAAAALLGIKEQVANLWVEITELPQPFDNNNNDDMFAGV